MRIHSAAVFNRSMSLVLAAAALAAFTGCAKPKVVIPTSFTTYTANDKNFTCQEPVGWAVNSYASGATDSGVDFTSASADIHIDADEAGSMWGDILNTPSPGGGQSEAPIDKLHNRQQQAYMNKYHQYVEIGTWDTTSTYGVGRATEYTADGLHGYRVNILGRERLISADTQCEEADWPALKAMFWQVINSIAAGPS